MYGSRKSISNYLFPVEKWNPSTSTSDIAFFYIDLGSIDKDRKVIVPEMVASTFPKDAPSRARQIVKENDVIVSTVRPNLNGVAKVPSDYHGAIASTGFCVLRPICGKLISEYLFHFVKTDYFIGSLTKNVVGVNYPAVSDKIVKSIEMPLPPLDDQIRIAHLLGKVEGLIAQRKQHLQQLDDLLKSVFLDMFGDPVRNEKGWDFPELSAFGKISTGNTPPRKDPSNYEDKYIEWIKTDNIRADEVFITPSTEHLSAAGAKKGRHVTKGALLVACIAGSVESIGRSALTDRTVSFNQQINAIQPNVEVNPFYLYGLFKMTQVYIQSQATKGMKKILTKGDFEKIKMIKPPLSKQNHFAAIVEKIEALRSLYQNSLSDLENLYGTLSQKAFKGELDLSRIPLIDETLEETPEDVFLSHQAEDSQVVPEMEYARIADLVAVSESLDKKVDSKPFSKGFARQVLAAEILCRYNDYHMTQMKLQKLIHLVEHHAQLSEIQGQYQRQAAGPYDNQMMYGLIATLKTQKWFTAHGRSQKATYSAMGSAGQHKKYLAHWQEQMTNVDQVLTFLGKAEPEQCEIVSTLYAAWNDLIIDEEDISDDRIIAQASDPELWHQAKSKIDPEKWPAALNWMREKALIPVGFGAHTKSRK